MGIQKKLTEAGKKKKKALLKQKYIKKYKEELVSKKKKKYMLSDWNVRLSAASAKPIKRKESKVLTEIPTKKKHIEANLPYKYARRKKDKNTGKLEDRAVWKARMKKEGKKVVEKKFKIYASKKLT